jgi:putative tricarboxylic transport membrane protein
MLRSGSRKTSALGGVATAVVLTLAACGSDGGADDGGWTPSRAIEVVAPAATGGGWDTLARTSSRILEESGLIDQDLRVINKPGAGGAIGWAYMAGATGDPHKLFVTSPPILLVPLSGESDHDHTDFTPIARLATDYMVYLASADSPLETFDDVVDALRDDPGGVSVAGGSAPGSMDHVAFAGAVHAAGLDPSVLNYVPFDGGGEAMTALLGGHVDVAVTGGGESTGLVEAGERLADAAARERQHLARSEHRLAIALQESALHLARDVDHRPTVVDDQRRRIGDLRE